MQIAVKICVIVCVSEHLSFKNVEIMSMQKSLIFINVKIVITAIINGLVGLIT
jgi:hypothetical protein